MVVSNGRLPPVLGAAPAAGVRRARRALAGASARGACRLGAPASRGARCDLAPRGCPAQRERGAFVRRVRGVCPSPTCSSGDNGAVFGFTDFCDRVHFHFSMRDDTRASRRRSSSSISTPESPSTQARGLAPPCAVQAGPATLRAAVPAARVLRLQARGARATIAAWGCPISRASTLAVRTALCGAKAVGERVRAPPPVDARAAARAERRAA